MMLREPDGARVELRCLHWVHVLNPCTPSGTTPHLSLADPHCSPWFLFLRCVRSQMLFTAPVLMADTQRGIQMSPVCEEGNVSQCSLCGPLDREAAPTSQA